MKNLTFRYRMTLVQAGALRSPDKCAVLCTSSTGQAVELAATGDDTSIGGSTDLVLRSTGWSSEEEARAAAERYRDCLSVALVRYRIGKLPDNAVPRTLFFATFLKSVEEQVGGPVLSDSHEVMVYPTEPPPRFISGGGATVYLSAEPEVVGNAVEKLASRGVDLSSRERLAIDLFNLSFLVRSAVARLVTLVMAVEALLEPKPKSPAAQKLVDEFMQSVRSSADLDGRERESLLSSLKYLKQQSIGAAGRSFVESRLGARKYDGSTADRFFNDCYDLRSRIVHGHDPQPEYATVGRSAANLEVLVSDLIVQPYIPLDLGIA